MEITYLNGPEIYVALTGDQVALTNIRVINSSQA